MDGSRPALKVSSCPSSWGLCRSGVSVECDGGCVTAQAALQAGLQPRSGARVFRELPTL
jgi:hypothetical protein